ncbi:MAG TPA: hypothetical protein VN612_10525 [Acidobacteriaceae bacterium]|nr:hypothetical protein [Acidobacteriaceae bacterium]
MTPTDPAGATLSSAIKHAISALEADAEKWSEEALYPEPYYSTTMAEAALLRSLIDPENQPNQFGVVIP